MNTKAITRKFTDNILFRRTLVFVVTAGICVFLIFLILSTDDDSLQTPINSTKDAVRPVTVIKTRPTTYQTKIEAYGVVTPEWEVAIKANVQGEILEVADIFRKGTSVKKGDILLTVEQAIYKVQLTEAMLELKNAKTKLLVEEKEGLDALANWKRSGIKGAPSSPLLLREPYLELAKADLKAAKEKVSQARLLLDYTKIKAPFDALIVKRHVSLGGTLFAGDDVGTLYGLNTFVVPFHISKQEWKKLPLTWKDMEVKLFDDGLKQNWSGKLMREGKLFEADSRLRTLFVEIENPLQQSPPLLPGNFVKAEIPGREIPDLLKIPDSARTPQGLVWYVDGNDLLQSVKAEPVFREKGQLYFNHPENTEVAIVINPNNSFVKGLKVTPVTKEN